MANHSSNELVEGDRIDACVAWMLEQEHLHGPEEARAAFLADATPDSMEAWLGHGNALLRGLDPEKGGYAPDDRATYIGNYPIIMHLGVAPTHRRNLMADTLEHAQRITKLHSTRLMAGIAFYATGLVFQQPLGDGNGRGARKVWGAIGNGISAEPGVVNWYRRLLREGKGNEVVSPRCHALQTLAARHAAYLVATETMDAGLDSPPIGVRPPDQPAETPDESTLMRHELYRRAREVTYGIPTLLRFILDSGRDVHGYIDSHGSIDAQRLAEDVTGGEYELLLESGESCKADFVHQLAACYLDNDRQIFGSARNVLMDFELSGRYAR